MLWFWRDKNKPNAYEEGFAVGYLGTQLHNPYPLWTGLHKSWEEGWNDGISFYTTTTHTPNFRREDDA